MPERTSASAAVIRCSACNRRAACRASASAALLRLYDEGAVHRRGALRDGGVDEGDAVVVEIVGAVEAEREDRDDSISYEKRRGDQCLADRRATGQGRVALVAFRY